MQLLLVGVSHRTAPVELRERLDFSARGVDRALTALAGSGAHHEATIVSTCNRVELYVGCDDSEAARAAIQQFLVGVSRHSRAISLRRISTAKTGQDAVTHLFRVAAGLDSLVMGEPQILGQVKDAFGVASQMGCTGPLLNKLFHSAFAAGKRVRSETALAEGAVSVSYAAVELARKIFGNLEGPHGARRRRRRDGQAHGHPHAVAGHRPADHHEPHGGARDGARAIDRRQRRCRGSRSTRRSSRPTS